MKEAPEPSVSVTPRRAGFVVRVAGVVDERFDGAAAQSLEGPIVFDLDGARRITSSGVRKWLEMLRGMRTQSYCFVRCRPAMVSQFNLVRQFGGNGKIVSLYAPYVCDTCGQELGQLIDLRRQHAQVFDLASAGMDCPCGGHAQFDDYAPDYFECAVSIPPPVLSPSLASLLDGDGHLKILKDVPGTFTALWLSGPLDGTTHFKRVIDGLEGRVVVVLQEVSNVTERGYGALATLTGAPDAQVLLARVPVGVAVGLPDASALGRAKVASVVVPLTCASCGREDDLELDEATLAVERAQATPRICTCGVSMTWPRSELLEAASRLPWIALDEDIAVYLAERKGPKDDGSFARNETQPELGAVSSVTRSTKRYEMLDRVAAGGMGVVYRGRVIGAGGFERRVAIKRIHAHLAEDEQFVAMFLDEARLAARIHHPNVVSTLDVEHGPDGLFIVMEYIDGGSADDLVSGAVAARTPLPTGVAVRVVLDMLAGLHAAHELTDAEGSPLNLVHRDVSPPNLLIGFDGVARLSDFGVAHTERRLAGSTQPGALKGKLGYMSPEQIGDLPVDRRSDIYAAGVVAWELLTGSWLFGDEWGRGILLHALKGPREAPHAVNGAVPVGVSEACMRALARDAIDRYASAAEFADAIERACAEANVSIANPTQVAETMRAVMAAGRAARGESASAR